MSKQNDSVTVLQKDRADLMDKVVFWVCVIIMGLIMGGVI